jgi:hypothetical protein
VRLLRLEFRAARRDNSEGATDGRTERRAERARQLCARAAVERAALDQAGRRRRLQVTSEASHRAGNGHGAAVGSVLTGRCAEVAGRAEG